MSAIQQALASYPAPAAGENARTTAWVNAVVGAGGSVSSGRRTTVNTWQDAIDAASLQTKLLRTGLIAAENSQSALVDVFGANLTTVTGGPSFTTDRGYTFNGSNYLNTGTTGTSPYALNAAMFGFALRTNKSASDQVEMGSSSAADAFGSAIEVKWSDGNAYFSINDGNLDSGRAGPASTIGIFVLIRTTSTLATLYKDGVSIGTIGGTTTSVPNRNFLLGGAFDTAGNFSFGSTSQFSAWFVGGGSWNGTDVGNFTTATQAYLTAVGA